MKRLRFSKPIRFVLALLAFALFCAGWAWLIPRQFVASGMIWPFFVLVLLGPVVLTVSLACGLWRWVSFGESGAAGWRPTHYDELPRRGHGKR